MVAEAAGGAVVKGARELARLRAAAIVVASVLDDGNRDPTWAETSELEESAIAYGRLMRPRKAKRST